MHTATASTLDILTGEASLTNSCGKSLSPIPELLPHHYRELSQGSGLTDDTIRATGIYSEESPIRLGNLLSWEHPAKKITPAMVFPYSVPDGAAGYCRAKPDRPRVRAGDKVKYESPVGQSNRIYIPPTVADALASPDRELLLTEGEKKALASSQIGFPCIGLVGVYGWKAGKRERLLPSLEQIDWKGRTVYIVFDSDKVRKPDVQEAEARLAALLIAREAKVKLVSLPDGLPGADGQPTKQGLDDFLVVAGENGPRELRRLLDAAEEPTPPDPESIKVDAKDVDPAQAAAGFVARSMLDGASRLVYWRGASHIWRRGAYREAQPGEFRARIVQSATQDYRRVTGRFVSDVAEHVRAKTLLDGQTEPPAWINEPARFEDGEYWPTDGVLVAKNGLVSLPRLVAGLDHFASPTPRFFSTVALDYAFDAEAARPAAWLEFLNQLWPDDPQSIQTLQEWFGYSLTPDTRQHKILLLIGPPRSGKGTIARVQRALVGPDNVAGPTLAGLGERFGLWPLLGKSLAIISDARLSGRTDQAVVTERLLSISGEDALTVDRKCQEPVTCKLSARLVIISNELPRLGDSSGALVGRMIVLRLTQSFFGREDHDLTDRLLAELPGILLWAVAGWHRLRERRHFVQPDAALELLGDMADLSSPIGAFVRECCVVGPGHRAAVDDLFSEWKVWCEAKGRREPGTEQTFGRDLLAAVPSIRRTRPREGGERVRSYEGIGLIVSR